MAPVDRSTYSPYPEGFPIGSEKILFSGERLHRIACTKSFIGGKSSRVT